MLGATADELAWVGARVPILVLHHGLAQDRLHTLEAAQNTAAATGARLRVAADSNAVVQHISRFTATVQRLAFTAQL